MSSKPPTEVQAGPSEKFNAIGSHEMAHKTSLEAGPVGLSFLDRSNVGNARLAGLERDLDLQGLDYNIVLAVFFPFYVAAEIPSNIMMKRTSPSLWISLIMLVWGACMTLMGFVQSFTGLLFARMSLGLAEGGLFPDVAFYITLWYRRHETGFRIAVFFSAATLAGAFGGLLASGISKMDGIGGRPGWSCIFIIEGLITIIVAIVAKFVITDNPDSAGFLTSEEKTEVKMRLKKDTDDLATEYATRYIFDALRDWKIWVYSLILFGVGVPVYSISFFLPTILANIGYSHEKAQLMSVPPYVLGCLSTVTAGYVADKYNTRGPFIIGCNLIGISGLVMLISSQMLPIDRLCSSVFPNIPAPISWNSNNVGGSTKRAVAIGLQVGLGSLSGMISGFSFRPSDAPRYFAGYSLLIGTVTMSTVLSLIMHIYLTRENGRRNAAMAVRGLTLDDYTEEMKYHEREKGDYASFFRYTT
ncbi:hypothetical protein NP233_g372 [Leucocoprinus birnbaumii]|uniref:Major facilitator superfamily (MFS) profile domain-containing protein n=1 Tax=Leucocoprinus birnbaumii TaxID=56174 RepID=A0AAD5W5L5_9AGAR|nr:hypothetical protein NP233_g372 [Leucocoprinus birnbaumii]